MPKHEQMLKLVNVHREKLFNLHETKDNETKDTSETNDTNSSVAIKKIPVPIKKIPITEECDFLDRKSRRYINIWKLICYSSSTAQLCYILETANQLRSNLGTDKAFNERNNLVNNEVSIVTGPIIIVREGIVTKGLYNWMKRIYNEVKSFLSSDDGSISDLSVETSGQTVLTYDCARSFPEPTRISKHAYAHVTPAHVAAQNDLIFETIISHICRKRGICKEVIAERKIVTGNLEVADDQTLRIGSKFGIVYDTCIVAHDTVYTKRVLGARITTRGRKRRYDQEENTPKKRVRWERREDFASPSVKGHSHDESASRKSSTSFNDSTHDGPPNPEASATNTSSGTSSKGNIRSSIGSTTASTHMKEAAANHCTQSNHNVVLITTRESHEADGHKSHYRHYGTIIALDKGIPLMSQDLLSSILSKFGQTQGAAPPSTYSRSRETDYSTPKFANIQKQNALRSSDASAGDTQNKRHRHTIAPPQQKQTKVSSFHSQPEPHNNNNKQPPTPSPNRRGGLTQNTDRDRATPNNAKLSSSSQFQSQPWMGNNRNNKTPDTRARGWAPQRSSSQSSVTGWGSPKSAQGWGAQSSSSSSQSLPYTATNQIGNNNTCHTSTTKGREQLVIKGTFQLAKHEQYIDEYFKYIDLRLHDKDYEQFFDGLLDDNIKYSKPTRMAGYEALSSILVERHFPELGDAQKKDIFERKNAQSQVVNIGRKGNSSIQTPFVPYCIHQSYNETVKGIADATVKRNIKLFAHTFLFSAQCDTRVEYLKNTCPCQTIHSIKTHMNDIVIKECREKMNKFISTQNTVFNNCSKTVIDDIGHHFYWRHKDDCCLFHRFLYNFFRMIDNDNVHEPQVYQTERDLAENKKKNLLANSSPPANILERALASDVNFVIGQYTDPASACATAQASKKLNASTDSLKSLHAMRSTFFNKLDVSHEDLKILDGPTSISALMHLCMHSNWNFEAFVSKVNMSARPIDIEEDEDEMECVTPFTNRKKVWYDEEEFDVDEQHVDVEFTVNWMKFLLPIITPIVKILTSEGSGVHCPYHLKDDIAKFVDFPSAVEFVTWEDDEGSEEQHKCYLTDFSELLRQSKSKGCNKVFNSLDPLLSHCKSIQNRLAERQHIAFADRPYQWAHYVTKIVISILLNDQNSTQLSANANANSERSSK